MNHSGQNLYRQAKKLIPGGTQLLSKRPEMYLPDQWPSYYKKVKGVKVTDLDGNKYIDMSYNALGACILGAADKDVDKAIKKAIKRGTMSTLNCPEEVELAELLLELHPWSDMIRYARCGGEAMSIAIRIARAASGKDKVAFCGYHGWHDWYLAANIGENSALDGHLLPGLAPAGVPRSLKGTAIPFHYNHLEELERIVEKNDSEIGVIAMEPIRGDDPKEGFLEGVRKIADRIGAVMIFDEVSSGFRLNCGGAHLLFGVNPDIAVFAKGISNGYPMAAILGTKQVMNSAQDTFISSTYWTESIGFVAALATIKKHKDRKVHEHLIRIGKIVQNEWNRIAAETNVEINVGGIYPLSHFSFEGEDANKARTLFIQNMLEKGFLATGSFYPTFAHTNSDVNSYLKAVKEVFIEIKEARSAGGLESKLKGPEAHSNFHRLI
ncbi:MAG: aminotransferase class III-fold pyridoxal phosphate-dependent enzyme [Kiritimatiellales bacterium]|nr:aminotransferase class III-fold pyridoxal phosphate-dependent enzyme [Kiritimatiellales bacterium]